MNSVNRAMGMRDLYPFVLSPAVIRKLGFIHSRVQGVAVVKKQGAFSTCLANRRPPSSGEMSGLT